LSSSVAYNKITGESLTYGFIKFANPEQAAAAISGMNGYRIGNKQIKVSIAKAKCGDIQNRKLFVHNLPLFYSESQVEELFSQYGDIIECRLLKEADKITSRGSAFVEFRVAADCSRAVSDMHETTPPGAASKVYVYFARNPVADSSHSVDHPPPSASTSTTFPVHPTPYMVVPPPCGTFSPSPLTASYRQTSAVPFTPSVPGLSPRFAGDIPSTACYSYASYVPYSYVDYTSGAGDLEENWIKIVGIPATTRLSQVSLIFEPFGYITSLSLDFVTERSQTSVSGSAIICVVSTRLQIVDLFRNVHNCCLFPGYPPVQLFTISR